VVVDVMEQQRVDVMDNKNKPTMNESMFSQIDQIRQDSKDVRDFVKKVFADREFKKMSNDKEFIKYLKSIYEGTVLDEEQVKFSSRDSSGNITTTVREETINEGTDIYINNRIQITKFSGGKDGKLIQINAPKVQGSGDHIIMKIDDFKKMLKKSSNLLKQVQETINEGLKHNDMYTMLDIAAGYSSTQDQAANQMWSDEQELYDYLKSDHIPKKYHKKFYNDVRRRFKKIKESVVKEMQVVNKKTGKDITKHVLALLSGKIDNKKFEKLTGLKKESMSEGDGLWANIRAKKARGEKPAHKNSKAHKDAVKAGNKINKNESVPQGYNPMVEDKKQIKDLVKKVKHEKLFYDVLDTMEKKYGKNKYRIWLEKSLKGFGVNPKHYDYRTNAAAEEKLYQLGK
jgi:hypothetical protein